MAIDSAAKRASIAGFIIPDGTLSQGDRQTIAGMYGGILAAAVSVAVGLVYLSVSAARQPYATVSAARRPYITASAARRPYITVTED